MLALEGYNYSGHREFHFSGQASGLFPPSIPFQRFSPCRQAGLKLATLLPPTQCAGITSLTFSLTFLHSCTCPISLSNQTQAQENHLEKPRLDISLSREERDMCGHRGTNSGDKIQYMVSRQTKETEEKENGERTWQLQQISLTAPLGFTGGFGCQQM